MSRIPFQRQHTGTFAGEQLQRAAQRASQKSNELEASLSSSVATFGQGLVRVLLQDADYTLTDVEAAGAFIVFVGTLTAARKVTVPRPASDAAAYGRWFSNRTTGGFSVAVRTDEGQVSVSPGGTDMIVVSRTYGPEAWF